MTNFLDLDQNHKKVLVITLIAQDMLLDELSEVSGIKADKLGASFRNSVATQVERLSLKEIDQCIEKLEAALLKRGFLD